MSGVDHSQARLGPNGMLSNNDPFGGGSRSQFNREQHHKYSERDMGREHSYDIEASDDFDDVRAIGNNHGYAEAGGYANHSILEDARLL